MDIRMLIQRLSIVARLAICILSGWLDRASESCVTPVVLVVSLAPSIMDDSLTSGLSFTV